MCLLVKLSEEIKEVTTVLIEHDAISLKERGRVRRNASAGPKGTGHKTKVNIPNT